MNVPWLPTEEIVNLIVDSGDKEALYLLNRYLTEPICRFEPLPDNPAQYQEQTSFVNDKFPGTAVALGGNGSGKTYCAAYKVALLLRTTPPPRYLCDYLVCAPKFQQCGNLWVKHLRPFITDDLIESIVWREKPTENPKTVVLKPLHGGKNNWAIQFMSYDQGAEAFASFSAAGFWLDEPVPWDVFGEINARTREYHYPGSRLMTLCPVNADCSELEMIYNNREKYEKKGLWKFYHFNSELNSYLPKPALESLKENTPDDLKATRLYGLFASYEGAVFKEFNPKIHIVEPYEIPKNWPKIRSIDWGATREHPTACLWIAHCPTEDRFVVYKEWEDRSGMLIQDKVRAIRDEEYWDDKDPNCVMTIADTEDLQQRKEFAALGISTMPADKHRYKLAAIDKVRSLLKTRNGVPRLTIFAGCDNLRRQMTSYAWLPNKKKPEVRKMDDDHVDCLNQAIWTYSKGQTKPWEGVNLPSRPKPYVMR